MDAGSLNLSGLKREWLVRAATRKDLSFVPPDIVDALVNAGLAERNAAGKLSVTAAGKASLAELAFGVSTSPLLNPLERGIESSR